MRSPARLRRNSDRAAFASTRSIPAWWRRKDCTPRALLRAKCRNRSSPPRHSGALVSPRTSALSPRFSPRRIRAGSLGKQSTSTEAIAEQKFMKTAPIHPETRIGHVHLTVSKLERALKFYRDALGFEVTQRYGTSAVFLSAGGYHHHIGLNTWAGEGASQPPPGRTGLYHFAILYPNRRELAHAFKRLFDHGVPIEGASDHGVSEAIYLRDPDGNGIELYRDRPHEEWPHTNGQLRMTTRALDLDGLLAELHDLEPKHETSLQKD